MAYDTLRRIDLYDDVMRNSLFILTLIVSIAYLSSGFPFAPLFDDAAILRAGFRVAFGIIYFVSLVRTRDALPILFGQETVKKNGWEIIATYYSQFPLLFFLIIGFLTEPVALILLLVRILFVWRTKRFGLENTLYQMIIVHMPFFGVGAAYSVDNVIGIEPLIASPVMFNSLFVLIGIMTVSGAYHKLDSSIWRRGDAVSDFLRLPHLRAPFLRDVSLPLHNPFSAVLSYSMILGQLILLFSVVNKWLFLVMCVIFIGFSVSLIVPMNLSFIGQTMLIVFVLYGGTVSLNLPSYPDLETMLEFSVTPFTGIAVFVMTLGLLTVLQNKLVVGTPIRTLSILLSGQSAPVKPFNEHHLRGVHNFRLTYEDPQAGEMYPVLEVYDEDGWQKQFLYPRHFQVSGYIITDYCLAVQHDEMSVSDKESELIDICCAGLRETGKKEGNIYVQIKIFNGDLEEYLEDEWQTIGVCRFREEGVDFELLNDPPRFEDHPRLDFEFGNS